MATQLDAVSTQQRELYEGIWTDRNLDGLIEEFTSIRLGIAGVRPRGRVLNVGAGAGRLDTGADGTTVTSIDLTFASCAALREQGTVAVQGDAAALPFRDGSFDTITILDVIEHVDDPAATLRGLGRVLRPGGTLVVTCPNAAVPVGIGLLVSLYIREWPTCDNLERWDPEHVRRPTVAEVRGLVEDAGLEVRKVRTWARSAFSLTFLVLCGARHQIRGRKLARVGLDRRRLDRLMTWVMRLARGIDHLLIGDRRSAIVLVATRPAEHSGARRKSAPAA